MKYILVMITFLSTSVVASQPSSKVTLIHGHGDKIKIEFPNKANLTKQLITYLNTTEFARGRYAHHPYPTNDGDFQERSRLIENFANQIFTPLQVLLAYYHSEKTATDVLSKTSSMESFFENKKNPLRRKHYLKGLLNWPDNQAKEAYKKIAVLFNEADMIIEADTTESNGIFYSSL